jgi:hypothetical protein
MSRTRWFRTSTRFWPTGRGLEYVGPAQAWDEEILRGSFADGSFTNWYLQDGKVKAALTFGRPNDLEQAKRLMVRADELEDGQKGMLVDLDSDLADVRKIPRARARRGRLWGDCRALEPQEWPVSPASEAVGRVGADEHRHGVGGSE